MQVSGLEDQVKTLKHRQTKDQKHIQVLEGQINELTQSATELKQLLLVNSCENEKQQKNFLKLTRKNQLLIDQCLVDMRATATSSKNLMSLGKNISSFHTGEGSSQFIPSKDYAASTGLMKDPIMSVGSHHDANRIGIEEHRNFMKMIDDSSASIKLPDMPILDNIKKQVDDDIASNSDFSADLKLKDYSI